MNHIFISLLATFFVVIGISALSAQDFPDYSPQVIAPQEESGGEKIIAEIPESIDKEYADAEDFRDPFFLLRGYRGNSEYLLIPGTTIDGIRFNSYADSRVFVENYYRDSNFAVEDVFGRIIPDKSPVECLHCHDGIEQISENHKFSCQTCHLGNPRTRNLSNAHQGMVSNPSDLQHATRFCGKCHANHIEKVKNSLMGTANGIKNATRYAWGEKANDNEPLVDGFLRKKCLRCHLQSPAPHRAGDYRAQGCAACHMIYANDGTTLSRDHAIQRTQKIEIKKNPDRFSQKFASASLRNKRGYPVLHKFTVAIPSVQCEHCHNNNGTGNEFEGLFGKPSRPKPHRLKIDAAQPVLYGREHEFLLPDIHREKNMHCIDCHGGDEIKGGASARTMHDAVKIRCEDCHGTNERGPQEMMLIESDPKAIILLKKNSLNPNLKKKIKIGDTVLVDSGGTPLPHIKKEKEGWVLFSKVTGDKHLIPVLKDSPILLGHSVKKHMTTMECHTCHARWSANEWGLHAIREKTPDTGYWRDWNFPDPTLQHILTDQENGATSGMLDWSTAKENPNGIQGEWKPGVWFNIFTETDWNSLILGKNRRGKYNILKPQHQYFISNQKDFELETQTKASIPITLDGKPGLILAPHTPHTIRRVTRTCESCHANSITAGLGDKKRETIQDATPFLGAVDARSQPQSNFHLKQMLTKSGEIIQTPLPFTQFRFLRPSEIDSLNTDSDRYKAYRYLDLRSKNFPRLLAREDYPYDDSHLANEKKFGLPSLDDEIFYDKDQDHSATPQNIESSPTMQSPQAETMGQPGNRMTIDEHSSPIRDFSQGIPAERAVSKEIPVINTPEAAEPVKSLPEEIPAATHPDSENPVNNVDDEDSASQLLNDFIQNLKKQSGPDSGQSPPVD